ncbi:MAG: DNA mismatch repair endonuclease MutL [Anaplasma sp.]
MPIVILNAQTVNKIAAGEVIDCPASVVKELVENSIDAGAKSISVRIERGGRTLISVVDDGCGIPKDEIEKAFICHATSKLIDGDLSNIKSMGFRGEGLTSIAAVGRVTLVSKSKQEENAWSVTFEGGEKTKDLSPEALSCGTSVEVRDLFFATPTRLKFLRTEKAETQSIVDLMYKLAMVNFRVSFSLVIGDKPIFKYLARGDLMSRLREMKPFGDSFQEQSLKIDAELDSVRVSGYTSVPTFNRSRPSMIYAFVNGRPVHGNGVVMGAIKSAYSGFISKDKHPVTVLCLDILPSCVDVNVHPSKLEVRFQDRRQVYNTIVEALMTALSGNVYKRLSSDTCDSSSSMPDHFAVDAMSRTLGLGTQQKARSSVIDEKKLVRDMGRSMRFRVSQDFQEVTNTAMPTTGASVWNNSQKKPTATRDDVATITSGLLVEEFPLGNAVCQLFERYIVSRAGSYAIIVDQHAAHERLTHEYMKKVVEEEGIKRQTLLMPEFVELDNEYELELLTDHKEQLRKFGLLIEPMGSLTVVVREVPAIFGAFDVKPMLAKIIESIIEIGETLFMSEKIRHVCGTIACYSSIRSGRVLKLEEMNSLLRQMESTPHSGQCNHGRPTYIKLSLPEIDKLFERT